MLVFLSAIGGLVVVQSIPSDPLESLGLLWRGECTSTSALASIVMLDSLHQSHLPSQAWFDLGSIVGLTKRVSSEMLCLE